MIFLNVSDLIKDVNLGISEIEETKPTERSRYFDRMTNWIRKTAKPRFVDLINQGNSQDKNLSMAGFQKDLAIVLHFFTHGQNLTDIKILTELDRRSKQIHDIFLGKEGSYIDKKGKGKYLDAKEHLIGPISILTFADLLKSSLDPKTAENLNLFQTIASEDKDVLYKTDLILDFGDKRNNKKIIRLVQLNLQMIFST